MNIDEVYRIVEHLIVKAGERGPTELTMQLDDALHVGSSGLEILGAIRQVIIENRDCLDQLLAPTEIDQVDQVISFVDKAFGR